MGNIVGFFQRAWIGIVIGLVLGLVLGLVIGWMTVDFKASADDVAMVADSFSLNSQLPLAQRRLASLSKVDQERYLQALIQDRQARNAPLEAERLIAFGQAANLATKPGATTAPVPGATTAAPSPQPVSGTTSMLIPIVAGIAIVGLIALAGVIVFTRVLPNMRNKGGAAQPTASAATSATATTAPTGMPESPAPTAAAGGLGRFVPSYTLGNDNYDTSYSLETGRGEFLGECGMGISERIGEGKPDKVTAFDLWLFDKADVRTVTQILMSEYAFKDQNLRTKLQTKGEAILAEKGKVLHLETQSLAVTAHIVELVYATNPNFAPNSHFQKLIVEIAPEFKTGGALR
jgi:hypothetical protein